MPDFNIDPKTAPYRIVFSPKRKRPGCVILQCLGGTVPSERFQALFPAEVWLTSLEDDMQAYPANDEILDFLSDMALEAAVKDGVRVTLLSALWAERAKTKEAT